MLHELHEKGIISEYVCQGVKEDETGVVTLKDQRDMRFLRGIISTLSNISVKVKHSELEYCLSPLYNYYIYDSILYRMLGSNNEDAKSLLAMCRFHEDHKKAIYTCFGSSGNHQFWLGGYADHINACFSIYDSLPEIYKKYPTSSVYKVLYFHDVDKLARHSGDSSCEYLREGILKTEYKDIFDKNEINALTYIHGEGKDYNKNYRVMGELAAICHVVDITSARILHSIDNWRI